MGSNESLSYQIRATSEGDKVWQQERTILQATERICDLMEKRGVNRVELAELIGKDKSRVSQLLDGTANMTLRTLSDIYFAFGRAIKLDDVPLAQSDSGVQTNGFYSAAYRLTGVSDKWETPASSATTTVATRWPASVR